MPDEKGDSPILDWRTLFRPLLPKFRKAARRYAADPDHGSGFPAEYRNPQAGSLFHEIIKVPEYKDDDEVADEKGEIGPARPSARLLSLINSPVCREVIASTADRTEYEYVLACGGPTMRCKPFSNCPNVPGKLFR